MTQKELAEKLNVSDKTLSRWETGKQIPDALTLSNIARALDLSISEMYGMSGVEERVQAVDKEKSKNVLLWKILKWVCVVIAAAAAIAAFVVGVGNYRLQSKVSYSVKEVPMYALTYYDYSILDWIKSCEEQGTEIACLSSLGRDPETGEEVAHYLFYLPQGYEGTEVRIRYRLGIGRKVLKLDFKNTTTLIDDDYFLCYVKVAWDEEGFHLETSLDGKPIRHQGESAVRHFAELCTHLFEE